VKRAVRWSCALVLFSALGNTLGAVTLLFNNGGPNQVSADSLSDLLVAEDFTLSAAATLTSFQFWDVEGAGQYVGSISWFVYTNSGGLPGVVVAQGSASSAGQITRTSTGLTCCFGFNEFLDDINMTASLSGGSLSLASGTYWLGLHNGPTSDSTFRDFYWETTANNATIRGQYQDLTIASPPWISTLQEHAFNISGNLAVPEPGTLSMFGAGLIGILALRRRKFSKG
jgi:PEP-CTERM motif